MIAPKVHTLPKSNVVGPIRVSGTAAMTPDTVASQDRIRKRAYELYEIRGREPGQDERDWLRAEQEILKR
jgi:hypothetical protein